MTDWSSGSGVTCPSCNRGSADGGLCGRDDCPAEATRARATFAAPPPPRQPAEWKRTTGLRVQAGQVVEIGSVVLRAPAPEAALIAPGTSDAWVSVKASRLERANAWGRERSGQAWRWLRERWVSMWVRIAQFMGAELDG